MNTPPPPHGSLPAEGWYDPELPFLTALEHEVARSAQRAAHVGRAMRANEPPYGADAQPLTRRGPQHARATRTTTTRVVRRSFTLVALLCLLGASAFGAREALSGSGASPVAVHRGALTLLAAGGGGEERWSLRAYRLGPNLCRVLVVDGNEGSRCTSAPAPAALAVTYLASPRRRYFFGVAGRRIAWVAVRSEAGTGTQIVHTRALAAALAQSAGLPARARYFLAILPRPHDPRDPPAKVRGLDAERRSVGTPLTVCVEDAEPSQCPN